MKLTDTQLVMLSRASQRDDHGIEIPATLKGAAADRTVRSLLDRGLIERVPRTGELPLWSTASGGSPLALIITPKGLEAIGVEPEGSNVRQGSGSSAHRPVKPPRCRGKRGSTATKQPGHTLDSKMGKLGRRRSKSPRKSAPPSTNRKGKPQRADPRPGSKLGQVLVMLRRPKGATVDDLAAATGWQRHTVRAALTGLRKRGIEVRRAKDARGKSIYRIAKG